MIDIYCNNDIQKLDKQYYCDNIEAVVDNFFIAKKTGIYHIPLKLF